MNASLSWIKAYVPSLDAGNKEFMDRMTLSGTKVEGFTAFDKNLENIVIGKILKIEKHPNADKLVVCSVDIGNNTVQIVTGATNVFEGAIVPVVLSGGKVAGGHDGGPLPEDGVKIKAGKLRGVESNGMMCSIQELGFDTRMFPDACEDGIYILPDDAKVGEDAVEYLGFHDANFEFEITSNRVDCYSVLGIAREAAATFGLPFKGIDPVVKNESGDINDFLSVEVKESALCKRYTARMVKNIRLAPSPKWLRQRLVSSGIRPINNIVDITNYVMEEFGQPMHAFDYDKIAGRKIIVRRAEDGDKFTTLDGQIRELDSDVLMICDGEKEIGIAGIMGGENSMITDDVKTMVFESASFDGINNRLSARRLGMHTDASGKYEKGLDPENAIVAINRACQLVEELDAGDVVGGVIDIYPEKVKQTEIPFEPDKINAYLGTDISKEEQLKIFPPLEIKYDAEREMLIIPSFRQDLKRGADIAEEVARFYGYDKIPATLPAAGTERGGLSFKFVVNKKIRETLTAYGYSEAMTYSFESPKVFDKLSLPAESGLRSCLTIANPLGEDFSVMRTSLVNGMLTSLSLNYTRHNKEARLFELSNIYIPKSLPPEELPDERQSLSFGFYGKGDFFTLKGAFEELLLKLGIKGLLEYNPAEDIPFLHPGRSALVLLNHKQIAFMGEVHPATLKKYGIETPTYIACADIEALYDMASFTHKFSEIPKFPAVTRDLSLVMNSDICASKAEGIIKKCGGRTLESLELFDVYQGERILKGKKSLAYSLSFRAKDHTLTDGEVNPIIEKMIDKLAAEGIELRK